MYTSAITMIESLIQRQHNEDEGGSYAYRGDMRDPYGGMSYSMGNSHDYHNRSYPPIRVGRYSMDDRWDGSHEYSEARGRDAATGRYVSRDDGGYSRHAEKEKMTHKLEGMLDDTQDSEIRDAISTAMNMIR